MPEFSFMLYPPYCPKLCWGGNCWGCCWGGNCGGWFCWGVNCWGCCWGGNCWGGYCCCWGGYCCPLPKLAKLKLLKLFWTWSVWAGIICGAQFWVNCIGIWYWGMNGKMIWNLIKNYNRNRSTNFVRTTIATDIVNHTNAQCVTTTQKFTWTSWLQCITWRQLESFPNGIISLK